MGSVWTLGIVNCHISNKINLENFLKVVKRMQLEICGVVETWFREGEGKERMEEIE